jgi:hypothetical protein
MAFIVHGASPFPGGGQGIGSDLIIHQPTSDLALVCATCAFTAAAHEELREHYKTEWHRHNLKRKVAGLAPISLADFEVCFKFFLQFQFVWCDLSVQRSHGFQPMLGQLAKAVARKKNTSAKKLRRRQHGVTPLDSHRSDQLSLPLEGFPGIIGIVCRIYFLIFIFSRTQPSNSR